MQQSVAERRVRALADLEVLDVPSDELFDQVVALAAALTGRSMAAVSLSDRGRQFFLSEVGLGVREVDADIAFCRYAVDGDTAGMEVPDTRCDARFEDNPLVTKTDGIRAYAGVPLLLSDGLSVGTLCVMDTAPGTLADDQRQALRTLADVVARLMHTRKVARDLAASVTERNAAQHRERVALENLRTVFDGVTTAVVLTDGANVVRRVNPAFLRLTGGVQDDFLGRSWPDLCAGSDRAGESAVLSDLSGSRRTSVVRELLLHRSDGAFTPVLASSSVAWRPDGGLGSVVTQLEDIAARRQAEIELRESQSALDGIVTVDANERIVSWNEGATRLLGHDRAAAIGKDLSLIVPEHDRAAHSHGFARLNRGGEPRLLGRTVELEALTAAGRLLPVELSLSRWTRGGEPFFTAVIRDISERRRHQKDLEWRATHDPATGLGNMTALNEWFDAHCSAHDDGRLRAVFCLQLTNLSSVSAALGQEATAQLLSRIGESLSAVNRDDLHLCHLRDSHFGGAVLMEADPHPGLLTDRLLAIARYVAAACTGPFQLERGEVEMQVHLGVVATRRRGPRFLDLLRLAERTRDSSPRRINIAPEILAAGRPTDATDIETLAELRGAVVRNEFELHYQPLTRLQPARESVEQSVRTAPALVEALVRWRHRSRGLVPPGQFIPLIEDSPFIFEVTNWVLHEALTQQVRWRDAGLDVRVAVNLSPQVLLNDDVVSMVTSALERTGARGDRLKVEITESALVADPQEAQDVVSSLHRLGVHVSLDDFGTGYTSLRLLRDLAVDEIKLDRLFVAGAGVNVADAAIANAVGQLGQRLGIRSVAEGVEDEETRSLFRALGYDYMQGYLDSRPLPADQVEQWLRAHDGHGMAGQDAIPAVSRLAG